MAASLESLRKVRDGGPPLATLTAYDYPSARLLDEAGVDLILVGDSLGMVVLGYEDTTHVTLAEMRHHTRAARRGVKRAVLVGDLPYKTYETPKQAVESARQLKDDGADAVKLEGGREVEPQLRALIDDGIPIIGHLGMLPQRIQEEGRYRKKGKSEDEAARLLEDAQLLDKLGVKAMVLESMFKRVAREITAAVSIPTIGIGAGNGCDGQILVTHDLIGAFPWFCPPFAIPKANVAESISRAVSAYVEDVRTSHD
ncbi:3-methyl-2-oxobutanoate hydroxymethyltransferase [bacterium]|jgi:3-methyl-2-oxobutanoate hydroxymethyltransferase|nr:3-methyl-2-oxobutanoate hydroxymethyltransferase [Verrucomicrobiales bacterium]MDB4507646.1 3-methyl-2-oxobutanoate hydroxymethyltransferase [bacterium]MDB4467900.1 3-methyl-2-oxobutanoate hydroxymethyltransferase [Verrucomicrobiales bacterium]MDB4772953.1 3-methyl-2-oxobutanoate hydroxymethyltransferase [Verrucomicrobiales bacterium]MDC0504133.1 3-methyl-2-oxobutanoate hydroxymethyltransferase [Verrucomicrobiales bacterium]